MRDSARNLKQSASAGYIDVSLEVQNNAVTMDVGGTVITETVSWDGIDCYFKAGTYPQYGTPEDFPADYHSLSYTGVHDTI